MQKNQENQENQENLVEIKNKDIQKIRDDILLAQEGRCALCGDKITEKTGVSLDHQHKKKADKIGEDGAGLVRGVLCRSCNVLEGKIWNAMIRFLQVKSVQDRVTWLESLIQYYKISNTCIIHPRELPKKPKIGKREFNKLNKYYCKKYPNRKPLEYPKSKKWTKTLRKLQEDYDKITNKEFTNE